MQLAPRCATLPVMPHPCVPEALRGRPFTRAEARAAGLSDKALESSPWRQVFRTVWLHQDVPDSRELRLAAARLVMPEYRVLCGLTARWVLGVHVRPERDQQGRGAFDNG